LTVYHLIDALPAVFFGLLGIWAAVVRRHWFLRFSVVCVFLLACLLLPAYEVVIEFGIAISLIMAGVWLARGRRHEPIRFSLESALLAMVVVAIGSAVIAKAPEFGWVDWLNLFGIGAFVALISLHCLWLVFGQASLWRRLPMSLLGFLVFTALYYFSSATYYLLLQPEWSYAWVESLWEWASNPEMLSWRLDHCIPTSLFGFSTLCLALVLARGSRWFTLANAGQSKPLNKRNSVARFGLVALMLCIFLPMCYLFYRLMTPTPYPVVEMPAENGWYDLVAASEMKKIDYVGVLHVVRNGTAAEAREAMQQIIPVLDRIDQGLSRTNFQMGRYYDDHQAKGDSLPIDQAFYCLSAKSHYAERFESPSEQISEWSKFLRFGTFFHKGIGFDWFLYSYSSAEIYVRRRLKRNMVRFNSIQCRQIVALLQQYGNERGSLENRLYYQRLVDENQGWLGHLQLLLQEWSGEDPYELQRQEYLYKVRRLRMLTVQFALQGYFLEHNLLPDNLTELVPDYLSAIPIDPHTNKPLHYQHLWGGYALSTLDDDTEDRALVTGPAAPYFWQRLQESWQSFRTTFLRLQRDYHPLPQVP